MGRTWKTPASHGGLGARAGSFSSGRKRRSMLARCTASRESAGSCGNLRSAGRFMSYTASQHAGVQEQSHWRGGVAPAGGIEPTKLGKSQIMEQESGIRGRYRNLGILGNRALVVGSCDSSRTSFRTAACCLRHNTSRSTSGGRQCRPATLCFGGIRPSTRVSSRGPPRRPSRQLRTLQMKRLQRTGL